MFYSKIFLDRNKTFVYLPIKFENQTQVSWLLLDSSSSATPTTWLIAHPTMEKISWPAIIDKTVYLYQKKPTYQTMSDFVKNPPPETKVLVEKSLKKIYPYSTIQGSDLPANFDQQAVDFILTTYKHSTIKDGVIQYENTIDATNGKLNAGDKLTWYLNVPSATKDNPFYIGEIHIDYR